MKTLSSLSLCIGIVFLLGACERRTPDVTPPPLGGPEQLVIRMEGIPSQNIAIDPVQKIITVTVPASVTAINYPATVSTAPGYRAAPDQLTFSLCNYNSKIDVYRGEREWMGSYRIVRKPSAAPMTIGEVAPTYETGTTMLVPVTNFYDDGEAALFLTHIQTGQVYQTTPSCCSDGHCGNPQPNLLLAGFDSDIPSGDYTLEIRKNNGRQAVASRLINVRRGPPRAYHDSYNPPAPGQAGVRLFGFNLHAEDEIELQLRSLSGDQYRLKPGRFAASGREAWVDLPANIKPGQYLVQTFRRGEPVASYSRMIVSRDRNTPMFVGVSDLDWRSEQPLVWQRNKRIFFTFLIPTVSVTTVRIQFTSSVNPTQTVPVPVNVPAGYYRGGPDGGVPSVTIPEAVPIGRYQMALQYVLANGDMVEGPPFERLVEVR